MTITLRQFVEHVAKRTEILFKKHGRVLPMYHAVNADGQDFIMAAPPGSKDQSVAQARAFLADCKAVRVAFIDEAWALDSQKTDPADIQKIWDAGKPISRHPNRIEIILISAEDATEGALMGSREIIRHGNRAILGKLKIVDFDGVEGRMVGLLPTPSSTTKH